MGVIGSLGISVKVPKMKVLCDVVIHCSGVRSKKIKQILAERGLVSSKVDSMVGIFGLPMEDAKWMGERMSLEPLLANVKIDCNCYFVTDYEVTIPSGYTSFNTLEEHGKE